MDAPRRLNAPEADRALRELFLKAGPLRAPDGLEDRVLARLAADRAAPLVVDRPLIGKGVWVALGALFLVALVTSALAPAAIAVGEGSSLRHLPDLSLPQLSALLTSPWTLMLVVCGGALFALEAYLSRMTPGRSGR